MNNKNDAPTIEPKDVYIGNPNAKITLMEFSDYETETGPEIHKLVMNIVNKYEGKVRFSFRHFPLLLTHQRAHKAAEAAVAAAQEGKFLEMHEILLQNRRSLGTISLTLYAKEVGILNKKFLADLVNGKYGWCVQQDLKEGIERGIKEIPALFVNNKKINGPLTIKKLASEIELAIVKIYGKQECLGLLEKIGSLQSIKQTRQS